MDVAFQNTRGALNATAQRMARDVATIEFISDEYDEIQRDGTYSPAAAFTLEFKAFFSAGLTPEQIQRLPAGGQTINEGATMTLKQQLDRYAQRVYVRGFWWRVVAQAMEEGITNFTLDKIAGEPGGVYE